MRDTRNDYKALLLEGFSDFAAVSAMIGTENENCFYTMLAVWRQAWAWGDGESFLSLDVDWRQERGIVEDLGPDGRR